MTRAVRAIENYAKTFNHKDAFKLSNASITDAGAATLAATLPGSRVESLLLSGNAVGDAGAVALAAVLPDTPNLRELVLSGNKVSDAGARALLAALPNSRMAHVDLCGGFSVAKGRIADATKARLREVKNADGETVRFS